MGARASRAGVHSRGRARRPALQVRRPSSARRSSSRCSRCRSSRGTEPRSEPSRFTPRRRASSPRPRSTSSSRARPCGGRDRERPPVRGDTAAGRGARAADGARRGRSPGRRRSTSCCRPSPTVAVELLGAPVVPRLPARLRHRGARPARVGSAGRAEARPTLTLAGLGPEIARSGRHAARRDAARRGRRAARPAARRRDDRGRPRPGRREPDGRRDQEDRADRAADREEPDQGLLRAARQRGDVPGRRGAGRAARLRPRPALLVLAAAPPTDGLETAVLAAAPRSLFDRRDDSMRALAARAASRARKRLLDELRRIQRRARATGRDRRVELLQRRRQLPGRLRGGAARAARHDRPAQPRARASWPTTSSGRTSTCCGCRSTPTSATRTATRSRASPSTTAALDLAACHARGVPAPPRQHQRDRRGAVRAPEHAAPAAAADHGAVGHRPAQGRLADGRDRGQAREARARRSVAAGPLRRHSPASDRGATGHRPARPGL